MKYWTAIPAVIAYLRSKTERLEVLDIGGNDFFTFPGATTVGWQGKIKVNLDTDPLPYLDKSVDFVFCRHTLEDLSCPENVLSEIARVAKAGYIETPSPMVEMSRNVDAAGRQRGYMHHRWFGVPIENTFVMLAKYPLVEHLLFDGTNPNLCTQYFWNVYHLWDGQLEYKVLTHENGIDLSLVDQAGTSVYYARQIENAITIGASNSREWQTKTFNYQPSKP